MDSIIRQQLVPRRTHPDDVARGEPAYSFTVYLDGWSEDRDGDATDRVTSQVYAGPFPTWSKAFLATCAARKVQAESLAPDRVEIAWSDPMPDPVPGMRHDPGGWVFRVFKGGSPAVSGTHHGARAAVEAYARRIAADKGLRRYPLRFLAEPLQ